ncbi:MAG: 2,3-bisphosphoglycerate-independent phosphoglycerate mutase [Candidatus Diapherotrites archaeon]|nr:2,3-bisphosphoglycerate-independent phosphoglycerate mutase [Candidatus Diapherotrites archaeon]
MKCLLIIADGAGDRPCKELKGRTPFQAAKTPNLDSLASRGITGLMDVISPGLPPGSDTAHLALFGYDPKIYYSGRGPFEALGAGVKLKEGDIALRGNIATVKNGIIIDRRAGRRDSKPFEKVLKNIKITSVRGVKPIVRATVEHRFVLILRGKELSPNVTDTDPHKTGKSILASKPLKDSDAARRTALAINEFTNKAMSVLKGHPKNKGSRLKANAVLLRGAGSFLPMPSMRKRYGLRATGIAKGALYSGVARAVGMKTVIPTGATGGINENYASFARTALKTLKKNDFVFVHIKGPDIAGHDGNPLEKVKIIEEIDSMIKEFMRLRNTLIVFTCDHSTPCSRMDHSGDPVPLVMAGPGVRPDDVVSFDEVSVSRGGLNRINGLSLMPIIIDLMDKSKKYGA